MSSSNMSKIDPHVKPENELAIDHLPPDASGVIPKIEPEIDPDNTDVKSTQKTVGKIAFAVSKPRRRRAPKKESDIEKPKKRQKKVSNTEIAPTLTAEEKTAMRHKAALIQAKLCEVFPNPPETFLDHTDAFTLLVAVVLSAQCLDATVNSVTPSLFAEAPTPSAMVALGIPRIKTLISKIGLNNAKSRYLHGLSVALVDRHGGEVPASLEKLEKLPGVGHKTASVVASHYFNIPAFPVDTHIHRLACRWGIGHAKSVAATETALKQWFDDPNTWLDLHKRIILFGRIHCKATRHDMDECPICSFAATDESREANEHSYGKFVAASSHANRYQVRGDPIELGQVRLLNGPDPDILSLSATSETPPPLNGLLSHSYQISSSQEHNMAREKGKKKTTPRVKSARAITKSPSTKSKGKAAPKNSKKETKIDVSGLRRSSRIKQQSK